MDGLASKLPPFTGGPVPMSLVLALEANIEAEPHPVDLAMGQQFKATSKPIGTIGAPPQTGQVLWSACPDDREERIPPRPWIAPGYLMRGSVTVVIGAPSAGKSTLMVAWSVALALGKHCNRLRPVGECRVTLLNVEDDEDEQQRRINAALRSVGASSGDLCGRVRLLGPRGVGILLRRDNQGTMRDDPAMVALRAQIELDRPDVLILDPLAELHTCEENDNTGMREVVARFRELARDFDMSVVLLHHTRKGSAGAAGDPDSGRGASAINGAARIVLTVASMTEAEGKQLGLAVHHHRSLFRLDHAKSNYAAVAAEAEWFERSSFTLKNGDQVAAAVPWAPPVDFVKADNRSSIEARVALGTSAGPYSPRLSLDARSIKHVFLEHGITTTAGQSAALKELTRAGFQTVSFMNRVNRRAASGLRSPDGAPRDVEWVETDQSGLTAKRRRSGAKPVGTAPVLVL